MVGIDDLRGLFKPKAFYDSVLRTMDYYLFRSIQRVVTAQ